MQLLDQEDALALIDLLKDGLPQQLLNIISREGEQREMQLVSECSRWFPRNVETTEIRNWVNTILDWFLRRGDIEKGSGGRYHCIPTYAIENQSCSDIWLCGDPSQDSQLHKVLRPYSLSLKYETIFESSGEEESSPFPIGLERSIPTARVGVSQVLPILKQLNIAYIRSQDLEKHLPRIATVIVPSESEAGLPSISSELWEIYDPQRTSEDRWKPDVEWQKSKAKLVRWLPGRDAREERSARVFYHVGSGRVVELGSETSSLWQLHLDTAAGNPRVINWDGTMLWFPKAIPVQTQQWLQSTVGRRFRYLRHWLVLEMNSDQLSPICDILGETLGLRWQAKCSPG